MSEHVISSKMYYTIWIALMCLTVITAAVSFIDLGRSNTVVASGASRPSKLCLSFCFLCM